MANSSMNFTEIKLGVVKKIKAAWTSDDTTGEVSGTTTNVYSGRLLGVITVPGSGGDAPSADYDIALNDDDGVDVALGALANRHSANTEYVTQEYLAALAMSKLTIAVSGAGNGKKGTVHIFIQ